MSSQGFQPVSARINSQGPGDAQLIQDALDDEARADIEFLQIAIDVLMRRGMTYEDILTAVSRTANADLGGRPRIRYGPPRPSWVA